MSKSFPIIMQHDSMQCGVVCLKMICNYFFKDISIEYISEQCFATTEGVSLPYWARRCVSGCISAHDLAGLPRQKDYLLYVYAVCREGAL